LLGWLFENFHSNGNPERQSSRDDSWLVISILPIPDASNPALPQKVDQLRLTLKRRIGIL